MTGANGCKVDFAVRLTHTLAVSLVYRVFRRSKISGRTQIIWQSWSTGRIGRARKGKNQELLPGVGGLEEGAVCSRLYVVETVNA
jgi:hypothetical protein